MAAPRETSTSLTVERQFEILKAELSVLQSRMDKYDDLIFRSRGWMVTIIAALIAGSVQLKSPALAFIASALPLPFLLLEFLWRWDYMSRHTLRYRTIRHALNEERCFLSLAIYDLTDHYRPGPWNRWQRFRLSLKIEMLIFYGFMVLIPFGMKPFLH
jgi:hypothetical protein